MKRKLLLLAIMVIALASVLAVSVSAATIYKTADGATLFSYVDENSDRIFESYEGSFPNYDDGNNALTWYITSTATEGTDTVHTVASFPTLDQTGTFASLSESGVYKYVSTSMELSLVSVCFPNDSGILTLSLSDNGYGNTYSFDTDTSNILFVTLPNTLTVFPSRFGQSTPMIDCTIDENAAFTSMGVTSFYKAKNLRSVDIPKNVTILYSNDHSNDGCTFFECVSLVDVDIAEGSMLETIQVHAFYKCSALKEFTVPNSVIDLQYRAFEGCSSLETIRLGANVGKGFETYNVQSLLYNCSSLKYVYMSSTMVPTTGSHLFNNGASGMVFFYTGDSAQYEALKATLTTLGSNGKFTGATAISWDETKDDQYYKDLAATDKKNYVVYNYSPCNAFYESEHIGEEKLVFTGEKLLSSANVCVICTRCNNTETTDTKDALFTNNGYSTDGKGAIIQGFFINKALVEFYEEWLGNLNYGLVAGVYSYVDGEETKYLHQEGELLTLTEGNVVAKEKVASVSFDDKPDFEVFEMKVSGLKGDLASTEVFCCAYVVYGGTIYYMNNDVVTEGNAGIAISIDKIPA